jgi:hypothetical protein
VCVRAASSNQSVIERGIGSFYTPDQLPRPLTMSKETDCTCEMVTIPLNGHRTICAHVTLLIIPLFIQKGEKSVYFCISRGSNP